MIRGALIFAVGIALGYGKAVQEQVNINEFLDGGREVLKLMKEGAEKEREMLETMRKNAEASAQDTEKPTEKPEGEHPLAG